MRMDAIDPHIDPSHSEIAEACKAYLEYLDRLLNLT